MEFELARHLLARTGFGAASLAEIEAMSGVSYEKGVRALIREARSLPRAESAAPGWSKAPWVDPRKEDKKSRRVRFREESKSLRLWWYQELLSTSQPLRERMTLFWHNHFTSSLRKVKSARLLYGQNLTLRRHALGSFREMLLALSRDPAMVVYLDNQSNHKRKPNENFAREVLELFTLGEGHYMEEDIQEAARAFTGWRIRRSTGEFRFAGHRHDKGTKSFMGKRGAWGGEDILRMVLEHPRVGVYLVEKMWREFVSPVPDAREVQRIARRFRQSDYQISVALEELLLCGAFRAPEHRGGLIKSPVSLLVGTVRALGISLTKRDLQALVGAGRNLGQDLFNPPNVKGWPGGERWITTHSLLLREKVLRRALRKTVAHGALSIEEWLEAQGSRDVSPDRARAFLLAAEPVSVPSGSKDARQVLSHLLLDPVFQLV